MWMVCVCVCASCWHHALLFSLSHQILWCVCGGVVGVYTCVCGCACFLWAPCIITQPTPLDTMGCVCVCVCMLPVGRMHYYFQPIPLDTMGCMYVCVCMLPVGTMNYYLAHPIRYCGMYVCVHMCLCMLSLGTMQGLMENASTMPWTTLRCKIAGAYSRC